MTVTRKMFIQVFLHTRFSPAKISSIAFIAIPSITKLVSSFTGVLFATLFTGQNIDKTLFVTGQTMVNLVWLKVSPVTVMLNIVVLLTLLKASHRRLPNFEEPTFICNGYNLAHNCSASEHFEMRP